MYAYSYSHNKCSSNLEKKVQKVICSTKCSYESVQLQIIADIVIHLK